jgi:predicted nucleic acid-binding protein
LIISNKLIIDELHELETSFNELNRISEQHCEEKFRVKERLQMENRKIIKEKVMAKVKEAKEITLKVIFFT